MEPAERERPGVQAGGGQGVMGVGVGPVPPKEVPVEVAVVLVVAAVVAVVEVVVVAVVVLAREIGGPEPTCAAGNRLGRQAHTVPSVT